MKANLVLAALMFFSLWSNSFAQQTEPPIFEDSIYGPYVTLVETHDIEGYTLEFWQPDQTEYSAGQAFRLLSPDGALVFQTEEWLSNTLVLGEDMNASGKPNLMIEGFSGGAHCCSKSWLFELSASAELLFESDYSECPVIPEDLDGDGISELVGCDDTWAYRYCSYAESPLPSVAWAWSGKNYTLESQAFPQLYANETTWALTNFLNLQTDEAEWTPTPECTALALTLPFLYRGEPKLAYEALKLSYTPDEFYDDSVFAAFDSADAFWQDILAAYEASALSSPFRVEAPDKP